MLIPVFCSIATQTPLTVLQRDKKVIEDSALKTKQPYLSLMDAAM
jgi:hypothetical protein